MPMTLMCDASESGLGADMLHNFPDGTERPEPNALRT